MYSNCIIYILEIKFTLKILFLKSFFQESYSIKFIREYIYVFWNLIQEILLQKFYPILENIR